MKNGTDSADRPVQIEVTEAMIDAGMVELRRLDYEAWEARTADQCREFVAAIYGAMASLSKDRNA